MRLILSTVHAILLCACSNAPSERWQALQDVPAYKEVNDTPPVPAAFIIKAGEECLAGETAFGKVDAYTKLTCKTGTGWVTASEHFKKLPVND